jgi:TPR repeat protein
MLSNSRYLNLGLAGLALGAALLAGCSDTGTKPAADAAKTAPQAAAPDKPTEVQLAALDKLKAQFANASGAEIEKKADELWAAKEYANAVALADMAYKKDKDRNAAFLLGAAYQGGNGVEKNLDKAWEYLSINTLDDVRYALYYRGLILADAKFQGTDLEKARENLKKAKELGVVEADAALSKLPG